jgi:ABC-2 type transport system permease protein
VIAAIFRVMLLDLVRDRAALAMVFVLPPLVFVILAAVFAGTSGEDLRPSVVIAALGEDARTAGLAAALRADPELRLSGEGAGSADAVREAVRLGKADVGLILRDAQAGTAPILIVTDPARGIAGAFLAARIESAVLGGGAGGEGAASGGAGSGLVELEELSALSGDRSTISYYAGAVAVMFLLFSAMEGAAGLIQERRSGIVDRLLLYPGGIRAAVVGKFLYLVAQGVAQVAAIFLVAWLVYGVAFVERPLAWLLTTLLAAAAGAGLGLALAAACATRQQAQAISTFAVLVCSAVGGSMVPRFLMPPWLQELGWLTPNAWAIEAYQGLLWRGEPAAALAPAWLVLAGIGLGGLAAAVLLSRFFARP